MSLSQHQEEKLRQALAVIVDTTPVGEDFDELHGARLVEPRSGLSATRAFAAAFVSIALIGGLLAWTMPGDPSGQPGTDPASTELVDFIDARYEVEMAGECAAGRGEFSSALVSVWGPGAEGKFRVQLAYPDGSSEWFITDSLVNVEAKKIWYPDIGLQYIGDALGNSGCWPDSISPNDFFDHVVIFQIGLLVSADNLITADGNSIADALLEQEPADVETIAGTETNIYTFPGPRAQTVWFDPQTRRLQKISTDVLDDDGNTILSETLTVLERKQTQIEEEFLDTTGVPLYSSTPGLTD